jgi:hypothetical protein
MAREIARLFVRIGTLAADTYLETSFTGDACYWYEQMQSPYVEGQGIGQELMGERWAWDVSKLAALYPAIVAESGNLVNTPSVELICEIYALIENETSMTPAVMMTALQGIWDRSDDYRVHGLAAQAWYRTDALYNVLYQRYTALDCMDNSPVTCGSGFYSWSFNGNTSLPDWMTIEAGNIFADGVVAQYIALIRVDLPGTRIVTAATMTVEIAGQAVLTIASGTDTEQYQGDASVQTVTRVLYPSPVGVTEVYFQADAITSIGQRAKIVFLSVSFTD